MDGSIPAWDLLARMGDDELVVVDCRSADERRRWPIEIPGALNMTVAEIAEAPWSLPDDELIVLYDTRGEGTAARRAQQALSATGRTSVVLAGGLHAWLAAGFPTEPCALGRDRAHAAAPALQASPGHG